MDHVNSMIIKFEVLMEVWVQILHIPKTIFKMTIVFIVGSDRNNMVQIKDRNENYPLPYERSTMWEAAEIKWIYHDETSAPAKDLAISMSSSSYYE